MTAPERYDPEASDAIMIFCPGCVEEIVVFQNGEIAEERKKPVTGRIPAGLMDSAFKGHFCSANDREYVCTHCHDRFNQKSFAEECCTIAAPRSGAKLVCDFDEMEDHHE